MSRAAERILANDPQMSVSSLRFLLIAGIKASTFLSGFRPRKDDGVLRMWQTAPGSLAARQAAATHHGCGTFVADGGLLLLTYWTARYRYDEAAIYWGPDCHGFIPTLKLPGRRLPETVATVLPGRPLNDLIDHGREPVFFAAKSSLIQQTHGNGPLALHLDVEWYPLSRVLARLG